MSLYSSFSRSAVKRYAGLLTGLGMIGVALALLVLLKALPYSTVRLTTVTASEVTQRPDSVFSIGPLHWRVRELATTPELQPFREAMRSSCGDRKGLAAAECASVVLTDRVPVGEPTTE